jgi:hypothetical protein
MDEQQAAVTQPDPGPDFDSVYANNARFEISVWDLKIVFGQLDQSSEKPVVDWHTAVTLPWVQAKLLSYYLQVNLAAYEAEQGRIRIPASVAPPEFPPVPPELENNPQVQAVREFGCKLREGLLSSP